MKIVIDNKIPFMKGQAEQLGTCVYLPGSGITAAAVRDADALIVRTRTRIDRTLLAGSRVSFVATATIGHDHIDKDYLREAGIAWANCPGCNAESVAQYVHSALLVLHEEGVAGPIEQLCVGIVGAGHVGTAVAQRLESVAHCRVLLNDPPRSEAGTLPLHTPLPQLLEEAHVVTLHTPLTCDGPHPTYHLANAAFFGMAARKPVFINAARGECMDTEAVKQALREGRIRATVIDTWEDEPQADADLLKMAVLATPHIAGYSADGKANGTRMALQAVARHFGIDADFSGVQPPALPQGFFYHRPTQDNYLRLYDPRRDSLALKAAPQCFEQLRGDYPLRREADH